MIASTGIIPAGAGKSEAFGGLGGSVGDHPRGCGEKRVFEGEHRGKVRSSPRVRGKATSSGEVTTYKGSSPRVRGKDLPARDAIAWLGIIPAGAGKRERVALFGGQDGDHPRGCGEKRSPAPGWRILRGSSPRVRGKEIRAHSNLFPPRIIPAGAGKRPEDIVREANAEDHPRGCGEKLGAAIPVFLTPGSSPRVRGKVRGHGGVRRGGGIIPAGAGKSFAPAAVAVAGRDHPRGCGEKAR